MMMNDNNPLTGPWEVIGRYCLKCGLVVRKTSPDYDGPCKRCGQAKGHGKETKAD